MKNKNRLLRMSLVCIALYVLLMSIAETLSDEVGIISSVTLPMTFVFAVCLYQIVKRNYWLTEIGLIHFEKFELKKLLFLLPFVVIASVNLWNGATLRYSLKETVFYIFSMLFVGFIEEVLFRGGLFHAMAKGNVKFAIIVSSLTFGAGHIANIAIGADLFETVLQIIYAVAIGFMFACFVYCTNNLWPGIICHGVLNALSAFSIEPQNQAIEIITSLILTVISVGYGMYLLNIKKLEKSMR